MRAAERVIEAGTVLVGKYRIEAVLGRGGMGTVYRARHLLLGEDVAIKILRDDAAQDEEVRARFAREGQSAVKIKSEHVARILDLGTSEDGLPFMVMEFLQGADLGQMIDTHGAMSVPVAIDLLLQACDAIVEAHSLGTVHRDVKPSNLFISFRPDQSAIVKVLDFGISKSAAGTDLSLTQTQSMLGTPAYMSPEQMRSARSVDARTDIWSLGTVLYELVEGRRPFEAASFSEMCVMVAVDPPARMSRGAEIEPIIARCLAKNQDDRYPHVAELMRDLAPYAGNVEAANHFVKRAYRTLGLGVPSRLESSPSITRGSYPRMPGPTPSAVHGAASAAVAGPVGTLAPIAQAEPLHTSTIPDRPAASTSGRWFAVVALVAALGVGAILVAVRASGGDEPAEQREPDPANGNASGASTAQRGSATPAGTAQRGSATPAGTAQSGSATPAGTAQSGNATAGTAPLTGSGSAANTGTSASAAGTGSAARSGSGTSPSDRPENAGNAVSRPEKPVGPKPVRPKPVAKPVPKPPPKPVAKPEVAPPPPPPAPETMPRPPAKPCGAGDPFAAPRPCTN